MENLRLLFKCSLIIVSSLSYDLSFGQEERTDQLPDDVWQLMGTCVESEKFEFLKTSFIAQTDSYDNLVYKDEEETIEFYFRPSTRHLNQIRVDLTSYTGKQILGLKKGMRKKQIRNLLQPKQVLRYGKGSYFIGERYSLLAAFEGWPIRKLTSFTVIYEGDYFPDRDMDGIVDSLDQCPDDIGTIDFLGCPMLSGVPQKDVINALALEYCRVVDTFRAIYAFHTLLVFPTLEESEFDHLLVPHKGFNPGISISQFDQIGLVSLLETEHDTSRALHLVSKPMQNDKIKRVFEGLKVHLADCPGLTSLDEFSSQDIYGLTLINDSGGLLNVHMKIMPGDHTNDRVIAISIEIVQLSKTATPDQEE